MEASRPGPASVPVVIASSHGVVGAVVRRACDAEPGVEVVAEVRDEAALLDVCRTIEPAVVVLDDRLSGSDRSLAAMRTLAREGVTIPVIVLADGDDGASILEALRLGARGFLRKSDGLAGLGAAVRLVAEGGRAIDPRHEQNAVMELGRLARHARRGSETRASLTPREMEILVMISRGATMRQVGRALGISPRTVETHVAKLYRKLGVRTRVQAVAQAAQLGLIDP
ncbi:MAG TPA: response regulator transcription factor [Actinomycetota bacterium]|nr:response regulator transcription factor [Actinomycetota bacterium]